MSATAPCPTCSGKQMLKNEKKKEAELFDTAFSRVPFVPRQPLNTVVPELKANSVASAFKGGICPTCGGKGKVSDGSDISSNIKEASKAAAAYKDVMAEHEANLGPPGGSRTTIIAGNETIQVGLSMNKAKSFNVVPGGTHVSSHMSIGESGVAGSHSSSNYVHGTNPLSTPGGHYSLMVSNKMSVMVGAQGIDIHTNGPLSISCGILSITAPQTTFGSSTGPTNLEGKHIQLNGGTISMAPSEGNKQVMITGSLGVQSNVVVGGSHHVDGDLSFTSGTAPSKIARTKFASAAGGCSGKAVWKSSAASAAAKDLSRVTSLFKADPSMYIMTPRGQHTLMQKMQTLAYASRALEGVTGICVVPGCGVGLVYNFVHVHHLEDGAHVHEIEVPNIKLVDTDIDLRNMNSSKQGGTPFPSSTVNTQSSYKPGALIARIKAEW